MLKYEKLISKMTQLKGDRFFLKKQPIINVFRNKPYVGANLNDLYLY